MKKYWFGLIILIVIGLLFIYKESLYISDKVYIIYKEDKNFYKNKYEDFFYYKKDKIILKFASFENKRVLQKEYEEIKNLNIITIDSLSKILPSSYYETHLFNKKKIDKLKILFIENDSINKRMNIKEVYQSFIEYD
jgi:hypothetical protein